MKLKDVTHNEHGRAIPFSFQDNRFYLFDKNGLLLDSTELQEYSNIYDIPVLDVKVVSFTSSIYFVGYPITHIKLSIDAMQEDPRLIAFHQHVKYGQSVIDGSY